MKQHQRSVNLVRTAQTLKNNYLLKGDRQFKKIQGKTSATRDISNLAELQNGIILALSTPRAQLSTCRYLWGCFPVNITEGGTADLRALSRDQSRNAFQPLVADLLLNNHKQFGDVVLEHLTS